SPMASVHARRMPFMVADSFSLRGQLGLVVDYDPHRRVVHRHPGGAARAVGVVYDDAVLARRQAEARLRRQLPAAAVAPGNLLDGGFLAVLDDPDGAPQDAALARHRDGDGSVLAGHQRGVARQDARLLALVVEDEVQRAVVVE